MTGSAETLANLQTALSMELTASHQYQLHGAVLDDWGIDRLAAQMREEMTEELGHSNSFLERILFLKGTPELTLQKTPVRANSLKEMFELDLKDEQEAIEFYTQSARKAYDAGDIGSRSLFEKTVLDEEGHMSWLELQLDLLDRMGEPAYISKHMSAPNEEA